MRARYTAWEFAPIAAGAIAIALIATEVVRSRGERLRLTAEAEEQSRHITVIERTFQALIEAETGQRGFLATQSEAFLEPFHRAVPEVQRLTETLRTAGSDQERRIHQQIAQLAIQRLDHLRRSIELGRSGKMPEAIALVRQGTGRKLMEQLRQEISEERAIALSKMVELNGLMRRTERRLFWTSLSGAALSLMLIVFGAYRLRASLRRARRAEDQYQRLAAKLQIVQENEAARLSRVVHDELGQLITAARLDLDLLARRVSDSEIGSSLDSARELMGQCLDRARQLSRELRPPVLDQIGLAAALETEAREFAARTRIDVQFENDSDPRLALTPDQEVALFRITREALTNVAQHSRAKRAMVRLLSSREWVTVEIEDDGVGIQTADLSRPESLGVLGMTERARQAGGTLEIESANPGTRVRAEIRQEVPAAR